jgi:hypothetical protein
MYPLFEQGLALVGMVVGEAIGPLTQGRLDESFSLTVCSGCVRSSKDVLESQAITCSLEHFSSECAAIVGHHSAHAHTEVAEIGYGIFEKLHGAAHALIGMQLRYGDTGMVINAYKQELPTDASGALRLIPCDAIAHAPNTPELLDIDMQQIAWMSMLVTFNWTCWLETGQMRQARTSTNAAHRRNGAADIVRDTLHGEPAPAQLQDRQRLRLTDRQRTVDRTRTTIHQGSFTTEQKSAHPFTRRRHTHPLFRCCNDKAKALFNNRSCHFDSTCQGESGILMNVHSAELLRSGLGRTSQSLRLSPNGHK